MNHYNNTHGFEDFEGNCSSSITFYAGKLNLDTDSDIDTIDDEIKITEDEKDTVKSRIEDLRLEISNLEEIEDTQDNYLSFLEGLKETKRENELDELDEKIEVINVEIASLLKELEQLQCDTPEYNKLEEGIYVLENEINELEEEKRWV